MKSPYAIGLRALAVAILLLRSGVAWSSELCIAPGSTGYQRTLDCGDVWHDHEGRGFATDGIPCGVPVSHECPYPDDPNGDVWTISSSDSDPFARVGDYSEHLYLWFACANGEPSSPGFGLKAAEFSVVGDIPVVSFSPRSGFVNAGNDTQLMLAVVGCPGPAVLAGEFEVEGGTAVSPSSWGQVRARFR